MKNRCLILFLLPFFGFLSIAENTFESNNSYSSNALSAYESDPVYLNYFGISSGINYGGLIAIVGDFNLTNSTSVAPYAGLGTWGFKLGVDLRYYNTNPYGRFFSIGISRASGLPEAVEFELKVNDADRDVEMFLDPVTNLNLGIGHAWRMGNRSRFLLEFGYALRLSSKDHYRIVDDVVIDDVSEKVMKLMTPGGLRLGLALNFGL